MSDDSARIEISAGSRQLDSGLREAMGKINRWAVGVRGATARNLGKLGATTASSLGNIVGNVAGRGMDFIGDQARGVVAFEQSLTRLGIAGDLSADKLDEIRQTAGKVAKAIGIDRAEVLAGTQAYVDLTGDVAGATASMETFARIAQASGASVADVSTAAAALRQQGVALGDMEGVFSGLIMQGKAGAVSLKDFAGELSAILPRWAKFNEGSSAKGIAEMGAAFQVARRGFGSASEAGTGLQALLKSLNSTAFAKTGIKIYDTNTKTGVRTLKSFEEIMRAIESSKLVKDPHLMTTALSSAEAEQTLSMILTARQHMQGAASDYDGLVAAGKDAGAVQRDLTTYLDSSAGRIATTWEGLKNAVAEALTPERIETFVGIVEQVAAALGKVIDLLGTLKDQLSGRNKILENPYAVHGRGEFGPGGQERSDAAERARLAEQAKIAGPYGDAAREKLKQEADYAKAAEYIQGGETRTDRIRRAVESTMAGTGGEATRRAGDQAVAYENAQKAVSMDEINKVREEIQGTTAMYAALAGLPDKIAAAIRGVPTVVAVDGNAIATANKNATKPRRAP